MMKRLIENLFFFSKLRKPFSSSMAVLIVFGLVITSFYQNLLTSHCSIIDLQKVNHAEKG